MLQYKEKFLAWFNDNFEPNEPADSYGYVVLEEAWMAGYQLGVKEERSRDKNLKDKYDH